jgi:hypothetical protein
LHSGELWVLPGSVALRRRNKIELEQLGKEVLFVQIRHQFPQAL